MSIAEEPPVRVYPEERLDAERAPPEKRRKVEDVTQDAVATELRLILDRSGAIAKAKFVPRFLRLISKERRLKHRLTLLTVVRLTRPPLQQLLLTEGLHQVLFRWIEETREVESEVTSSLYRAVVEFLMELPSELLDSSMVPPHTKDVLDALIASSDAELRVMTERLRAKWNAVGVMASAVPPCSLGTRITLENECCVTSPPPSSSSDLAAAHSLVVVEAPPPPPVTSCLTRSTPTLVPSEMGVRRVEGLNSPLPRAFKQKPVPKRICKTPKRVRWAAGDALVSVQLFHETDFPIQLFQSGSGITTPHTSLPSTTAAAFVSLDMKAEMEWRMPVAMEMKAAWRVKTGEESQEQHNQADRERHVVAFDPENVIGDFGPDEPYHEDTIPDPKHRPKTIKLDTAPAKSRPATQELGVPRSMDMVWPGVVMVPSGPVVLPSGQSGVMSGALMPGTAFAAPQSVYFVSGMPRKLH